MALLHLSSPPSTFLQILILLIALQLENSIEFLIKLDRTMSEILSILDFLQPKFITIPDVYKIRQKCSNILFCIFKSCMSRHIEFSIRFCSKLCINFKLLQVDLLILNAENSYISMKIRNEKESSTVNSLTF